jgi:hypothetical protein
MLRVEVHVGLENEPVRIRTSGAPTRCPYCHADVDRDREAWLACHACLAPHHRACWSTAGACAGCGETRSVGEHAETATDGRRSPPRDALRSPEAKPADGSAPVFELELRGRNAHFESDASFVLYVRPDRDETFTLRVRNDTDAPQRVELRRAPGWLRVLDHSVEFPAAGSSSIRIEVVGERLPEMGGGEKLEGELELGCGEQARTVRVETCLAPEVVHARRRRRLLGAAIAGGLLLPYTAGMFAYRERIVRGLAERGRQAQAMVTEIQPRNHNQMYFAYDVGGVSHERHESAGNHRVGDTFVVTYLPEDPDVAVIGDAYDRVALPSALPLLPFVALLVTLGYFLITALQPNAFANRARRDRR